MTIQSIFKKSIQLAFLIFTLAAAKTPVFAELIEDHTFGFSVDIPEGYNLAASSDDNMSLIFDHPNIPVTLALRIYQNGGTSTDVLQMALEKLKATGDVSSFKWNGKESAVSMFKMTIDINYEGWAVCAPTKLDGYFVTLLCYSNENQTKGCMPFIISSLNSLKIGTEPTEGIITAFSYPKEGEKKINLNIGGNLIQTKIDEIDAEAQNFVINMEYSVLVLYANHPKKIEAWKRYYKIIYEDSAARLAKTADDIYTSLAAYSKQQNPAQPELGYAQTLLSWVQTFNYRRDTNKMDCDFTSLPAMLCGEGNDCDSRSMLLSVLLNKAGIETIMIFSPEYSHAMAAAKIAAPGQTFTDPETGSKYLMGETTTKITWGIIHKDHADRSKWLAIHF